MPLGRRRPLMRAAMVGGTAYAAGKHVQRGRERESGQEERIDQMEAQQQAPPAPAPAAGGMTDEAIQQLQKLGQLREAGILTDAEFAAQKQKLLAG